MADKLYGQLQATPMLVDDVPYVDQLERVCFSAPWPASTYRYELQHNRLADYWVIRPAAGAGEPTLPPILAYGGYWLMGEEAHIVTLATHPDWRRHGLAEWLLLEMLALARRKDAQTVTLEVRAHNQAAQHLYQKLGFVEVGVRKRYYRDNGEDARLFTLFHLDDSAVWQALDHRLASIQSARKLLSGPVER
jgi:ribosomal-protein-alanine N-acetyltransferase